MIVSIEQAAYFGAEYNPVVAYVVNGVNEVEVRMDLFEKLRDFFGEDGYFFVDDFSGRGYTIDEFGSIVEWLIVVESLREDEVLV